MTNGERLVSDLRRTRRAGDPRLTENDRKILRQLAVGDDSDEMAQELAGDLQHDEMLGGHAPR